jgi:hypothetical protein
LNVIRQFPDTVTANWPFRSLYSSAIKFTRWVWEQRMTTFCPLSTQPVFLSGQIQTGAYIQVYDAGTLTPRTAYKDGLAQTPWAQIQPGTTPPPGSLVTDGNGCIPNFWVVGNPYKVRVTSQSGVQIREVDNLPGDVAQGGGGGGGGGGRATLKTGDYVWAHTTAVITGRVRANGKTIGNAVSGATEFADASTQSLFVFLWNADASLSVSGGRGASALADFNANKTITLPDLNARAVRHRRHGVERDGEADQRSIRIGLGYGARLERGRRRAHPDARGDRCAYPYRHDAGERGVLADLHHGERGEPQPYRSDIQRGEP